MNDYDLDDRGTMKTLCWTYHILYGAILFNLVLIISGGSVFSDCVKDGLLVSEVFCLPRNYRKDVPPNTNGPLSVYFKLPVTEVSEIDDHKSQLTLRLAYKLRWPEHRMLLNESADWSEGEINVRPELIDYFWSPDIIIHDLISFVKPQVLNDVGAMEILRDNSVYYKVRWLRHISHDAKWKI